MGLFANLTTSVKALNAFEQSLEVAQNNVSNASTAGYAKQLATLNALPFHPGTGLLGGVQAGAPQTTRDEYLEDMPAADTVMVLQELAARRDMQAELNSPLLPG